MLERTFLPVRGPHIYLPEAAYSESQCYFVSVPLSYLIYSRAETYTHVSSPEMHGKVAAEFPLVSQLPQGELFQDFTVAPSTHPHDAGLLTLVDAYRGKWRITGLRKNNAKLSGMRVVWDLISTDSSRNKLLIRGKFTPLKSKNVPEKM